MAPAPAEADMCPPAGVALAGKVPGEAGQTEQLIRPLGLFYIGLYMGRRQQPWVSVDSAEAHAAAWTPGSRLRLCSGRSVTRSTCEVCGRPSPSCDVEGTGLLQGCLLCGHGWSMRCAAWGVSQAQLRRIVGCYRSGRD